MSAPLSAFFRKVAMYHEISRTKDQAPVTIVNGSYSHSLPCTHGAGNKSTEESAASVAIDIFRALMVAVGVANMLPSLLRPLNYSRHVEALRVTREFTDNNGAINKDDITKEIVQLHTQIAKENCGKAKKLLASALVFTSVALAKLTFKSNKQLSPQKMNALLGLSLGFGVLSHCYYTLRTPELSLYYPEILKRAFPQEPEA